MYRGMKKPRELKIRHYADFIIDINEFLDAFPEEKTSGKIGETELSLIILNSMPNGCSKQLYVQGFYCESIAF